MVSKIAQSISSTLFKELKQLSIKRLKKLYFWEMYYAFRNFKEHVFEKALTPVF
jgi:hypothetical protein